jgi:glycosyltransferase involved in cell wall biosynthesis
LTAAPAASPSVTFVSPFAQPAGSERYLGLVLDGLPRASIRDVVFLQEGPFADAVQGRGYPVTVIPTWKGAISLLRSALRLRRLLGDKPPQLVHANGVKAALVAALALVGKRIPLVWVKHDLSFDRSLARVLATRCRLVVGVSGAAVSIFTGRTRRKVRVVPNALPRGEVDRPGARTRLLESLGLTEPAVVVGLIGRLYRMKGQHELVEIVPAVLERVPGLHVAFLGGVDDSVPEYAAALRRRVTQLGLDGAVTLLGHRDDAAELTAGLDALAVPSVPAERGNREAFSLVALEAMAAGTPVVGYAEGGLPEVLGSCALLVPTGDRAALSDALARVLQDDQLGGRLAACGRKRVADRYTLEAMLESLQDCYREAVAG